MCPYAPMPGVQVTVGASDMVLIVRNSELLHSFGPGARALPNDCGPDCALFFVSSEVQRLPLEGWVERSAPGSNGAGGPVFVRGVLSYRIREPERVLRKLLHHGETTVEPLREWLRAVTSSWIAAALGGTAIPPAERLASYLLSSGAALLAEGVELVAVDLQELRGG